MSRQSQETPPSEHVAAFFEKHRTGLLTIVFTDLVDSTALMQRLGNQAGATFLKGGGSWCERF
jgi:class 3 adenylate cyclase